MTTTHTNIIIAVIGLIGVVAAAVLSNWGKIFIPDTPTKPPIKQDISHEGQNNTNYVVSGKTAIGVVKGRIL